MGDFQPEDHVNGEEGLNFIALIFKSFSTVSWAIFLFKTISQNYKKYYIYNLKINLNDNAKNFLRR